ncbi:MAG TPA: aconitate hydratase AcnA, partial [Ignavibacteriaceae bacterium]|nr:aconitate hydratase AcnA [Ignavibacteriaceae bacterium]
IAEILRKYGVVGKFVEVFGDGLKNLTVPDRATISNMSPEFGCTITYFPPDDKTLEYLKITGRTQKHIDMVEKYLKTNLLWRENEDSINYSHVLNLKLEDIVPSIAGPKRPQDKISLDKVKAKFIDILKTGYEREYITLEEREEGRWLNEGGRLSENNEDKNTYVLTAEDVEIGTVQKTKNDLKSIKIKVDGNEFFLSDGSVVIAAITSCTNTSNPSVMIGSGIIAKNAVERGLKAKPWVKTSLAPGSRVVTKYFEKANLIPFLEALGFHVVGYGCTTCIGNSGQLPAYINKAIVENNLITASVLSGNRNFEARIHSLVKMNFLMSPILVVAYALAGRMDINFYNEPLGYDPNFQPVYLKDIWPASDNIQKVMREVLDSKDYKHNYKSIFNGNDDWNSLKSSKSEIYNWNSNSSYIKEAPFFKNISPSPEKSSDIISARVLLKLGDSITTDHISPAGAIAEDSPAGKYLKSFGIEKKDFNSYGSRRGNHEVMVRGTFANVRLKNQLADKEGGWTIYHPTGDVITVFDAAMKYSENKIPLIILAGKEYGSGSSRDWAAKGVSLLGVRAIIAESFERIHRSNLIGMGVLPLQFENEENCGSLSLNGDESYEITGLDKLYPNKKLKVTVKKDGNTIKEFNVVARIDSSIEIDYYMNGGILQYVLRNFLINS